jgi:hypothetical protein
MLLLKQSLLWYFFFNDISLEPLALKTNKKYAEIKCRCFPHFHTLLHPHPRSQLLQCCGINIHVTSHTEKLSLF